MRSIGVLILFVTISNAAYSQTVQRIDIFEYGIYSVNSGPTEVDPGGVNGTKSRLSNIKLLETTKTIPARIGVNFGFRYRIFGEPNGAHVQIKEITLVPEPGVQNPKTGKTITRGETVYDETIDSTRYKGYEFEDTWELLPGEWTFEIWQGERKLASQRFEVVKP